MSLYSLFMIVKWKNSIISILLIRLHLLDTHANPTVICKLIKINENAITQGIKICKNVPGRLESFSVKTGAKVIIDYAHTPDAYVKILGTLKSVLKEKNNL